MEYVCFVILMTNYLQATSVDIYGLKTRDWEGWMGNQKMVAVEASILFVV